MYKENENKYENKYKKQIYVTRERKTNLRHARERNSTEKYGKYVTIKIYVTIESEKILEHVRLKKRDFSKRKRVGS